MAFPFTDKSAVIATPCVGVCEIEPASALCKGCRRTLAEIAAWGTMPDAERQRIMNELGQRSGATRQGQHVAVGPR